MDDKNMKLWYEEPARQWVDGMPLGNGRFGAMVLGKLRNESICLNDDTVWARGPDDRNNPDALAHLPQVRKLLMAGKVEQAQALAEATMIGTPKNQAPYQVLGELSLLFTDHVDDSMEVFRQEQVLPQMQEVLSSRISAYTRELDLDKAVASVRYKMDGTEYLREYFASQPDGVFAVHLTASGKGRLNLMATLFRKLDTQTVVTPSHVVEMHGRCGVRGSQFCTLLHAAAQGGTITPMGNNLCIENADEVTLLVTCETDVRSEDFAGACKKRLHAAAHLPYPTLKRRHLEEYRSYFRRVQFGFPADPALHALPTNRRLQRVRQGETDLGLMSQYFHFGRYLLISSSRPDSMPAHLQGIWCDSFTPPWDSKYTLNINTQMNYWPAESCALGDCHQPLFQLADALRAKGRVTARAMYGCRGFVAHHNTDLGGDTAPLDHTKAGLWPMGAAWLCYHLWQHYEYSCDHAFLRDTAYPILRESAEFFFDYLFEDDRGWLLSGPSLSPENRFITPDGQIGSLCLSPAMDIQILSGLFGRCLAAAEILGAQDAFTSKAANCLKKLPPMRIGKDGCLQEWLEDYPDCEPGHRHLSHLFAVYPGCDITRASEPQLYEAARKALRKRVEGGSGGTGWSTAWIAALLARFGEGDTAFGALQALLAELTADSLLDMHPPGIFQIDGNLGAVAAISEMLLQDDADGIVLLPALPACWKNGWIKGLRARGGLAVDILWNREGQTRATFHAGHDIQKEVFLYSIGHPPFCHLHLRRGEAYTIAF